MDERDAIIEEAWRAYDRDGGQARAFVYYVIEATLAAERRRVTREIEAKDTPGPWANGEPISQYDAGYHDALEWVVLACGVSRRARAGGDDVTKPPITNDTVRRAVCIYAQRGECRPATPEPERGEESIDQVWIVVGWFGSEEWVEGVYATEAARGRPRS